MQSQVALNSEVQLPCKILNKHSVVLYQEGLWETLVVIMRPSVSLKILKLWGTFYWTPTVEQLSRLQEWDPKTKTRPWGMHATAPLSVLTSMNSCESSLLVLYSKCLLQAEGRLTSSNCTWATPLAKKLVMLVSAGTIQSTGQSCRLKKIYS